MLDPDSTVNSSELNDNWYDYLSQSEESRIEKKMLSHNADTANEQEQGDKSDFSDEDSPTIVRMKSKLTGRARKNLSNFTLTEFEKQDTTDDGQSSSDSRKKNSKACLFFSETETDNESGDKDAGAENSKNSSKEMPHSSSHKNRISSTTMDSDADAESEDSPDYTLFQFRREPKHAQRTTATSSSDEEENVLHSPSLQRYNLRSNRSNDVRASGHEKNADDETRSSRFWKAGGSGKAVEPATNTTNVPSTIAKKSGPNTIMKPRIKAIKIIQDADSTGLPSVNTSNTSARHKDAANRPTKKQTSSNRMAVRQNFTNAPASYQINNEWLGHDIKELDGSKFYTNGEVLSYFFNKCGESKAPLDEKKEKKIALDVAREYVNIWKVKKIKTTKPANGCSYIMEMYVTLKKINSVDEVLTRTERERVMDLFGQKMAMAFSVAGEDAEKEEDCPAYLKALLPLLRSKRTAVCSPLACLLDRAQKKLDDNNNVAEPVEQAHRAESPPVRRAGKDSGAEGAGVSAKLAERASKPAAKKRPAAEAGLDAASSACSNKHTGAKSALAGTDADQMPASGDTLVDGRRPPSKKTRLPAQVQHVTSSPSSNNGTSTSNGKNSSSAAPPKRSASKPRKQTETNSSNDDPEVAKRAELLLAMCLGKEEFCEQLESHGWPDVQDCDYFFLEYAVMTIEDAAITELLLQFGCRVIGDRGAQIFHRIVEHGWLAATKLCLDHGAQVGWQDAEGNTALHVCYINGAQEDLMEMLASKLGDETAFEVVNACGLSTWHLLCGPGSSAELVKTALARGRVRVDSQVPLESSFKYAGYTTLHFAVHYNSYKTAMLLLEKGADVYARDATQSTPLHLAFTRGSASMLDLLLTRYERCDDRPNNRGLTHFMCACAGTNMEPIKGILKRKSPESIKKLIEAKVQSGPLKGLQAKDIAAKFGRAATVKILNSL